MASRRPVARLERCTSSRYLPEEIMLDTRAEVDSKLEDRHRQLGSGKQAILRDVRSRLVTGKRGEGADESV